VLIKNEKGAKKSLGIDMYSSPDVAVDVAFFLKLSKSTDLSIRSSADLMNTGRLVTNDVSVFSVKS
jgi:hypothetical protein